MKKFGAPEMRGEKRASGERRTEESEEKKTFLRPLGDQPDGAREISYTNHINII